MSNVDLDNISIWAKRADADDPDCWFDANIGIVIETANEQRHIENMSPRVTLAMVARIRELEACLNRESSFLLANHAGDEPDQIAGIVDIAERMQEVADKGVVLP